MKILFLSHSPNNPNGGASRLYHLLTAGLGEKGHSVTTLHLEDFDPPDSKLARLFVQRFAMPQWITHKTANLDFLSFDVIMSSSGMAFPIFKRLYHLKKRPVLVNHCHQCNGGYLSHLTEERMGHTKLNWSYKVVTGPLEQSWSANGMIWNDLTIVQNLRDLGEVQRDPRRRALVVPPALHPDLLEASKAPHSLSARDPAKILWFGTWECRKGAYYVPAAFRQVRQKRPDATLTLGGTGKSPSELLSKFDPADREAIKVLPRISVQEQIDLFNTFSIFLFPSLSEGFGLALPEAMSFGLAAVTTHTAFGGDYLEDGTNARVVYPSVPHLARAMLSLIENDELRWRMAMAGRDIARTFTFERMVTGYEKAFADALELRSSSPTPVNGRSEADLCMSKA